MLALFAIALSVLAYAFFSGASERVKAFVFVLLFLAVVSFGVVIITPDTVLPPKDGPLVTQIIPEPPPAPLPIGAWGVVFGSDGSLEAAQDEITGAAKRGIPNASVFLRNGHYASIAVVDDRTLADTYLALAKGFRDDAYIAAMANWCKQLRRRDGFFECQATSRNR